MNRIEQIKDLFTKIRLTCDKAAPDVEAFTGKGNKSAGTRVRKEMQAIRGMAKDIRGLVQSEKNAQE